MGGDGGERGCGPYGCLCYHQLYMFGRPTLVDLLPYCDAGRSGNQMAGMGALSTCQGCDGGQPVPTQVPPSCHLSL